MWINFQYTKPHPMAVFHSLSWVGLFILLTVLYLGVPGILGYLVTIPEWYTQGSKKVLGTPPNFVFAIVWTILGGVIVYSAFDFVTKFFAVHGSGWESDLFVFSLFINYIFFWMWMGLFFTKMYISSFIALLVIFATAIIMWGVLIVCKLTIPAVLFSAYPLWLIYAGYLNFFWVYIKKIKKRRTVKPAN